MVIGFEVDLYFSIDCYPMSLQEFTWNKCLFNIFKTGICQ